MSLVTPPVVSEDSGVWSGLLQCYMTLSSQTQHFSEIGGLLHIITASHISCITMVFVKSNGSAEININGCSQGAYI